MSLIPSNLEKITTCSKKCSSLRRRSGGTTPKNLKSYKDAVKRIAKKGVCEHCGKTHGPFVVKDVKASFQDDGELLIDESEAKLWCQHCHLESIALIGGLANSERIANLP